MFALRLLTLILLIFVPLSALCDRTCFELTNRLLPQGKSPQLAGHPIDTALTQKTRVENDDGKIAIGSLNLLFTRYMVEELVRKLDPEQFGKNKSSISLLVGKSSPYHDPHLLKILSTLGFTIDQGRITEIPSYLDLLSNYNKALDGLGIPIADRIQPALIYMDVTKSKHILVTPGFDPVPDPTVWHLAPPYYLATNLSRTEFMLGLRNHRFPLHASGHDLFHLVSFIQFPKLFEALLREIKRTSQSDEEASFVARLDWALEILEVPDKAKKKQIEGALVTPNSYKSSKVSIEQTHKVISGLSRKRLLDHARKLAETTSTLVLRVGGAVKDPYNLEYDKRNSFYLLKLSNFLLSNPMNSSTFDTFSIRAHMLGELVDAINRGPNDYFFKLSIRPIARSLLLPEFVERDYFSPLNANELALAYKLVADLTASLEFGLWNGLQISEPDVLVRKLFSPQVDWQDPDMNYLATVFFKYGQVLTGKHDLKFIFGSN